METKNRLCSELYATIKGRLRQREKRFYTGSSNTTNNILTTSLNESFSTLDMFVEIFIEQ